MRHLLLPAQAWWDAQRFDQPVWHVAAWRDQKVRHIQLHVAKALGKVVAAYGEEAGGASGTDALARVRDEVMPDVAIYRSQLLQTGSIRPFLRAPLTLLMAYKHLIEGAVILGTTKRQHLIAIDFIPPGP
jgi:hypothetical protein